MTAEQWAPPTAPKECCRNAANLTTIEQDAHVLVRRCVCGLRHFKATLAPDVAARVMAARQASLNGH